MLFSTPNFYLVSLGSMFTVLAFDLLVINIRTTLYDKTVRDLKAGVKSGLDRRETFFKNIFNSNFQKKPSLKMSMQDSHVVKDIELKSGKLSE